MNRGFVVVAQNTESVDYIKCAEVLATSIKKVMPDEKISIITDSPCDSLFWDHVIPLPYGDLAPNSSWKLMNDWQVYDASPYTYTIKLEADLFIPRSIEFWWDVLKYRDVVISTTVRNFKQEISNCRFYRKFIDDNNLPDCYNAISYFKKSPLAMRFYYTVKNVFENWTEFKNILKCGPNEEVTTDWAYAIACHIIGEENTTLPSFNQMSMIHMKQHINELLLDDWTKSLVYEISSDTLRINTFPQLFPFHYQKKSFASNLG